MAHKMFLWCQIAEEEEANMGFFSRTQSCVSEAGFLLFECDCGVSRCPPARPSAATQTRALVIHRQITQFTSHLAAISSSPVTARALSAPLPLALPSVVVSSFGLKP